MNKQSFIVLLSLVPIFLYSQNYFPMPESDVIWSQSHSGIYCNNQLHLCSEYQYTFGGDTIIGSNTYKIINRSGYLYDENLIPTYFFEYAGGFRQNIENKKVFFVEINNDQEELLYDFDLNPGDTLPHAYNNQHDYAIVSSIDSVLIGNQYRKRFNLEYTVTGATEIIEGIGSNAGLLEPLFQFEDNYRLECFNLYDSIYYPTYGFLCDLISGFKELGISNNSLEIIPNPVSGTSIIKISGNNENHALIEIINVEGQTINRIPSLNKTSIAITRNELTPGFYFCILKSKENTILQIAKFVVR